MLGINLINGGADSTDMLSGTVQTFIPLTSVESGVMKFDKTGDDVSLFSSRIAIGGASNVFVAVQPALSIASANGAVVSATCKAVIMKPASTDAITIDSSRDYSPGVIGGTPGMVIMPGSFAIVQD